MSVANLSRNTPDSQFCRLLLLVNLCLRSKTTVPSRHHMAAVHAVSDHPFGLTLTQTLTYELIVTIRVQQLDSCVGAVIEGNYQICFQEFAGSVLPQLLLDMGHRTHTLLHCLANALTHHSLHARWVDLHLVLDIQIKYYSCKRLHRLVTSGARSRKS